MPRSRNFPEQIVDARPPKQTPYRDLDFYEADRDDRAFGVTVFSDTAPGLYGPTTGFNTSRGLDPSAAPARSRGVSAAPGSIPGQQDGRSPLPAVLPSGASSQTSSARRSPGAA